MPEWLPEAAWLSPPEAEQLLTKSADAWEKRRVLWLMRTLGALSPSDPRDLSSPLVPRPRPEQVTPPGDEWSMWFVLGGRGSGKTRLAAEDMSEFCRTAPHENTRCALIGPTLQDVRVTMVEGETGMLSVLPPSALRGGTISTAWNRGTCELYLSNGAYLQGYSSQTPGRLRGPQHHRVWCDEPAEFYDSQFAGDVRNTTVSNALLGNRLGEHPRTIFTGTPKPVELIRWLLRQPFALTTRMTTYDNLINLPRWYADQILAMFEGTTAGRQELMAELVEMVEGALWTPDEFEEPGRRIEYETQVDDDGTEALLPVLPRMNMKVVAVDPSMGGEAGIVVCGRGVDGLGYVIEDCSQKAKQSEWAKIAVEAAVRHRAFGIVLETNLPPIKETTQIIRSVPGGGSVLIIPVTAHEGKAARAGPVLSLWQQHKWKLGGRFPLLENQMCLVAGTLVTTARGDIPIETVIEGDRVLTREGWGTVDWAGQTGVATDFVRVTHDAGVTLSTCEHPIFIQETNEFAPAMNVRPGQHLIGKPSAANTASPLPGGATGSRRCPVVTIEMPRRAAYFIERYGKRIEARSPRGWSFITSTMIRLTIASTIWRSAPMLCTAHFIRRDRLGWLTRSRWSSALSACAIGGSNTKGESTSVESAGTHSTLGTCEPSHARIPPADGFRRTVLTVHRESASEPVPVFNLRVVDGPPEFFADGVLVHNCTWVPKGLPDESKWSPNRIDAMVWGLTYLLVTHMPRQRRAAVGVASSSIPKLG